MKHDDFTKLIGRIDRELRAESEAGQKELLEAVANEPSGRHFPTPVQTPIAEALCGEGLLVIWLPECAYSLSEDGRKLFPKMTVGAMQDALAREYGA